jgi:predicted nuclease of restriction endonuclease-like (RecB) superfamily
MSKEPEISIDESSLLKDVCHLIDGAKVQFNRQSNTILMMLYWAIGQRINIDILKAARAEYGKQVINRLSERLLALHGRGYGARNLHRMVQLVRCYPDHKIVSSLMTKLGWTHFIYLLTIDDSLKRDFYAEMCRIEGWQTRELIKKINSMYFERIALAKKPKEVIAAEVAKLRATNELTADLVIQDPLILDSLAGQPFKTERSFEQAILDDIEGFLLHMGNGFAFLERQKSIEIDGEFHRIDLLMYHRRLRSMIVVELKMGKFKAQDKGQIELYLRWLEKNEMQPGENPPIGIVLCSEKSDETVELLQLEQNGIRVCQFLTELPPKEIFVARLHAAIDRARSRQEQQNILDELDKDI